MRLIIVSGVSGSGKSIALQTLEDLDYYCVDNLPVVLLKPFAHEVLGRPDSGSLTAAVGIDARNFRDELENVPQLLEELREMGLDVVMLFLTASDQALLQRYSDTRRLHPLSRNGMTLVDAIKTERGLLEAFADLADLTVDTSHSNVHDLRQMIRSRVHEKTGAGLSILFESFGFKGGVPADADFVFDVRCLPNPHWDPLLRPYSGRDEPVINFLSQQEEVKQMLGDLTAFLATWIPRFETGSRSYLTVAIGCTGGHHRSVYLAETLAEQFSKKHDNVQVRHRELA